MAFTSRRETYKTLSQTLLGEPVPLSNSKDDMVEYIRRLMLKLSSGNLLNEIELETTLANAVVRMQVISVLPSYFLCRLIDGETVELEPTNPTYVKTLSDLHTLVRDDPTGHFKLANDINATAQTASGGAFYNAGKGWDPIGDRVGSATTGGFSGFFDGNGKTITGLMIDRDDEDYIGLFGFCGTGAVIKDLTLKDIDITGATNVGGLAGNSYATISDCHITGTSTITGGNDADNDDIGGLVGDNDGWINGCSAAGTIHGMYDVGGLAGDNDYIITNSSSSADVYGSQKGDVGGLVGDNKGFKESVALSSIPERGTITNCFATGNVYSEDTVAGDPAGDIGGLVGDNRGGTISSSYSTGDVDGKQPDIGGFVGSNQQGDNLLDELKDSIISNCFCTGAITPSGNLPAEGDVGGFVGDNQSGQIFDSYCANAVTISAGVDDREDKGDFCGDNTLGSIIHSYYDSTLAAIGSSDGGTGKTTAELKKEATFVNWDFTDVWTIVEDTSYPTLPDAVTFYESEVVEVYPIAHTGNRSLSADVRPKIAAGMSLHAVKTPGGIYYTPTIFQDYNFPVGRTDITDDAVGKDALSDLNGDSILGFGVDWNGTTEKIDVDPDEFNGTGLDYDSETGLLSVDLSELDVADIDFKHTNPQNKLLNGNFKYWSDGDAVAPDNWVTEGVGVAVAREDALEKLGDYSTKITAAAVSCYLVQAFHTVLSIGYWSNRTVTIGAWVYATVANKVRIYILDGVGASSSSYHTGDSTWQWLSASKTVDAAATHVSFRFQVLPNSVGYIDGAIAIEGENDFAFSPHPLDIVRDALGDGLDYDDATDKIVVDIDEVLNHKKIFELSFNDASDSDLDSELNGAGTVGVVINTSGQNENGTYGQAFDASVKTAIVWSGYIPFDYDSSTDIVIKCRWCLTSEGDAGATVWRWHSIWNEVEIADASVIGEETVSAATDEAVGAAESQRTMHTITLATIDSLTAGDLLTVALLRDAIHANDTCTKKIMVLDKIFAEYTSDKIGESI